MLVAPSSRPGVVLSQPPISTAPSTGWERSNSSASIASMLRSASWSLQSFRQRQRRQFHREAASHEDAALDVVDRLLKCMWQGCASDHVLRIAITGRRSTPPASSPSASRRTVTEAGRVVGREPARAAESRVFLVVDDECPFLDGVPVDGRKIGFSTIRPMMITIGQAGGLGEGLLLTSGSSNAQCHLVS